MQFHLPLTLSKFVEFYATRHNLHSVDVVLHPHIANTFSGASWSRDALHKTNTTEILSESSQEIVKQTYTCTPIKTRSAEILGWLVCTHETENTPPFQVRQEAVLLIATLLVDSLQWGLVDDAFTSTNDRNDQPSTNQIVAQFMALFETIRKKPSRMFACHLSQLLFVSR